MSKLHVICLEDLYNNKINIYPKSFPSSTRITKFNSEKHAVYGRRFEISMLCYDVSNYDCCGKVCINHDDNFIYQGKTQSLKILL